MLTIGCQALHIRARSCSSLRIILSKQLEGVYSAVFDAHIVFKYM